MLRSFLQNSFQRTLLFIKDWIDKMIQPNSVTKALKIDTLLSSKMTSAMQQWVNMYIDEAEWLTSDQVKPIKSLRLPSAIAGEIARMVTIEMKVEISGSPRADYLTAQIDPVLTDIKQIVEQGSAKGGFVLKPYPSNGEMLIDVVYADAFYPVRFNSNRKMTACVFRETIKVGQSYYTRLEFHQMGLFADERGNQISGCQIQNAAFRSSSENDLGQPVALTDVAEWADLQPSAVIKNAKQLLVGYFRPPLANNIDPSSPLGVSCYARAVDLIKQADKIWSDLIWEFDSGERAIYVDELALQVNASTGNQELSKNRLYRGLNVSGGNIGDNKSMYDEWSPEFRDEAYRRGLNDIFKRIEFVCGIAYGTLSDPAVIERTATEIINAKQRTASTVVDNQKALRDALDDTLYAMDVLATIFKTAPQGTYQASYSFDDSVVVDHDTQFTQDSLSLGQKTMSRVEFRMRTYGETEEVAKKKIEEIDADSVNRVDIAGLFQPGA